MKARHVRQNLGASFTQIYILHLGTLELELLLLSLMLQLKNLKDSSAKYSVLFTINFS